MSLKKLRLLGFGFVALLLISSPSFSQTWPYYVLDGWGGVHAGGGAAAISPTSSYFGWDIAKAIDYFAVANSSTNYGHGILVLDGYGGVHKGGKLSGQSVAASTYFGWNIARDIVARIIPPRANYSSYNVGNTEVTSSTYVVIRSVTIRLPDDGYVFMAANCALGNNHATVDTTCRFAFGVDGTTPVDGIERYIDLPSNAHPNHWHSATITQMDFLTAGQHTINFLIREATAGSAGQVLYFDPTLCVILIDQSYYGTSGLPEPEESFGGGQSGDIK